MTVFKSAWVDIFYLFIYCIHIIISICLGAVQPGVNTRTIESEPNSKVIYVLTVMWPDESPWPLWMI